MFESAKKRFFFAIKIKLARGGVYLDYMWSPVRVSRDSIGSPVRVSQDLIRSPGIVSILMDSIGSPLGVQLESSRIY